MDFNRINIEYFAHSHLSSENIFNNIEDLNVYIGDYGFQSLKKFCRLFQGYETLNVYSAPEIWDV